MMVTRSQELMAHLIYLLALLSHGSDQTDHMSGRRSAPDLLPKSCDLSELLIGLEGIRSRSAPKIFQISNS